MKMADEQSPPHSGESYNGSSGGITVPSAYEYSPASGGSDQTYDVSSSYSSTDYEVQQTTQQMPENNGQVPSSEG